MLPADPEAAAFTLATRDQLGEIGLAEPGCRLVLIDGRFAPGL